MVQPLNTGFPGCIKTSAFPFTQSLCSVGLLHCIQSGCIFTVQTMNWPLVETISLILWFLLFLSPCFVLFNLISQDNSETHRNPRGLQPLRFICCSSAGSDRKHKAVFQILPFLPAHFSVSTRYSHPWSRAGRMNSKTGPDPVKSILCTALNYSSNLCSESHWSDVG